MSFTAAPLESMRQEAKSHAGQIEWAVLADLGQYKIEHVRWQPRTHYFDHFHQDLECIFLLTGDLSDGEQAFHHKPLLTYPVGSRHRTLRTEGGGEFVLIWTGAEQMLPVEVS